MVTARRRASKLPGYERRADERRLGEDTWQVSARAMEALQVMSLLLLKMLVKALVQVFVLLLRALLKVAEVFSLLSPLTQPQTTMPQTRPGGA